MNPRMIKEYAGRMSRDIGKRITRQEAEQDIMETIQRVSRNLAPKYTFGYRTVGDIEQEAFLLALEVLEGEGYDPSRPLENFLYVHLRRRLSNNIRRSFYRGEPPCECCPTHAPPASPCKKWLDWQKRN